MPDPILQSLIQTRDTTMVQGLHWLAKGAYKTRKYQWELRRNGETKLGYWRKSLKKRSLRSAYPKRFVLIPGFGDTPLSWSMVMGLLHPILKMNFDEVILFDFPGFGGFLSRERAFPSMDLMMSALSDALDSLKPHTIMGHSLGGWLTAHYAAQCGQGTRPTSNKLNYSGPETIILGNPSGIFLDQRVRDDWEGVFKSAMVEGFSALRPHLFAKEPPWFKLIAPHFTQFLKREDVLQFMTTFREEHCVDRIADQIRSKVWLVWGEKDSLIPASCTHAWFKHLNSENRSNQNAIWLRGVGHSPHLEKPAITAAVIGQILSAKTPHALGSRWWQVMKNEFVLGT